MAQVFISYSKDDRKVAERIAEELRLAGIKVFDDRQLAPGEDLEARLYEELKRAAYVLLLLSPSYLRSAWARKELEVAALSESEGGPRLIPLVVADTPIPPFLRNRVYLDLSENPEAGFEALRQLVTTPPRPLEPSRTRRSRRIADLFGILLSLLGAAASALLTSVVHPTFLRTDLPVTLIVTVLAVVGGLTALVAAISLYRPHRRSRPIELVATTVEHAYLDALDVSDLNPLRVREVQHG